MSNGIKPQLTGAKGGKLIEISGDLNRFLLTGAETGGSYAQWEAILPPGGGPPVHVHSREQEALFVLEGEVTAWMGDERILFMEGMSAHLPIGLAHGFKNETSKTARILFTAVPAGLENFFFEAGTAVEAGMNLKTIVSEEERRRMIAKGEAYGIRFIGARA